MALPSSAPIDLSAIQTEFSAGSLSAAATAAGVSANMLAFLGKSAYTATLYDYTVPGTYTWVKPSGANTMEAICVAGGGAGGGAILYYGSGGGGGAGFAYKFSYSLSGISSLTLVVGGVSAPNLRGRGTNGNNSSISSGGSALVTCPGGSGGWPGSVGYGGDGGDAGAVIFYATGYGGAGNPADDTGTNAGGGGGNGGNGEPYYTGGGGGPASTLTLAGGTYSYYVSPGGNGQAYTSTVTSYSGFYGGGGKGAYSSFTQIGEGGGSGRIVLYVTP